MMPSKSPFEVAVPLNKIIVLFPFDQPTIDEMVSFGEIDRQRQK